MTTVIDTSDLDRYVGQSLGGGQLKEPVAVNDIRRWVQGMQYPNPIHYDEEHAARSRFGRIVAPQSFSVCCDIGHGALPSVFGKIPGSHMIFGGDEWWFYGPRIAPGDKITVERRHLDYRVAETKFAGSTVFSRGDSTHVNQRGERISTQRSTSVRYLADQARHRGFVGDAAPPHEWSAGEHQDLARRRRSWILSGKNGTSPRFAAVEVGTRLPQCPIGPHTIQSFTTEWRSFVHIVWGTVRDLYADYSGLDGGWLPEMSRDYELAKDDPSQLDGAYAGASRGHLDPKAASIIGMPRAYGYGASMGAWALNYAAYWAGDAGFVRHSNVQYRFPPLEGDVSLLDATVTGKRRDENRPIVTLDFSMTNQSGSVLAKGQMEVELPE